VYLTIEKFSGNITTMCDSNQPELPLTAGNYNYSGHQSIYKPGATQADLLFVMTLLGGKWTSEV
jgi:hypothetical protein